MLMLSSDCAGFLPGRHIHYIKSKRALTCLKGQTHRLWSGHRWARDGSVYPVCLRPGYYCDMACFLTDVCVRMLLHCTGGRQQGQAQASEQVEYHRGGNNTVWTPSLLGKAWREMLQVLLTAHCCSPCARQNLAQVHPCGFVYVSGTCCLIFAQKKWGIHLTFRHYKQRNLFSVEKHLL